MEALDATAYLDDDLLDFSSDVGEEDDKPKDPSSSSTHFNPTEDCAEEELEWLLNKDAFPSVDTFVDIMSIGGPNYCSPVSVLENSSSSSTKMSYCRGSGSGSSIGIGGSNFSIPVRRPRTKRRRRGGLAELPSKHWWSINITESKASSGSNSSSSSIGIGRKCQHCQAEKTPQWRAGPMGPKTLCNACGVRYKSGRLVPEYRPANSPTFSSKLHSNSHRKVVEMRKGKQEAFLSECNSDSQRKIVEMRKGKQEGFLSECNSNSQRKVVEMRKGKQQENMMVNASCG